MNAGAVQYFPGIHALRGIAALLVVVQHAGHFAAVATGRPEDDLVKIGLGSIGVTTFFTISGFVIALNRHLPTTEFVCRRALRIYPAFWAAYALSSAIALLADHKTNFLWSVLFLLPTRESWAIHLPLWTLIFEVFFYFLAAIVFSMRLSDRTLTALALCWIVAIESMYPYLSGGRPTLSVLPGALIAIAPYNVFFALGMICALNLRLLVRIPLEVLLVVAVVATALLPLLPPHPHVTTFLVLGIGLCSILIASIQVQKWPKYLLRLGDASYGLFLLHYAPMISAAALLAGTGYPAWALFLFMITIGLAVGVPFGLLEYSFHRKSLRFLLAKVLAQRSPTLDPGALK